MYDLCAYFTNDGTVGLYSEKDDDIYHSTYGALSEAWEKFIIPSNLENLLSTGTDIKILDICYGIGYNSKAAIQYFFNFLKKNKLNENDFINLKKKFNENERRNSAIHTDNILSGDLDKNSNHIIINNDTIYTDNNSRLELLENENMQAVNSKNNIPAMQIDAVDIDKILIQLSPFFATSEKGLHEKRFNYDAKCADKLKQVHKLSGVKNKKPQKTYRLSNEVTMLLIMEMEKTFPNLMNDNLINELLSAPCNSAFFDKNMINFAAFYQNKGCKHIKIKNKTSYLHNIYYRYLSKSYKLAQKVYKNDLIRLNFYPTDARTQLLANKNKYNLVFLDAFTPAKCPMLWTLEFIEQLYDHLDEDGMILTYSNSVVIRNTFLQAGFNVGKIFDKKINKFIGTVACKNIELIKFPLDEKDLILINSKAGIPYRDINYKLSNREILLNREKEFQQSELVSSSKALKGLKNAKL